MEPPLPDSVRVVQDVVWRDRAGLIDMLQVGIWVSTSWKWAGMGRFVGCGVSVIWDVICCL